MCSYLCTVLLLFITASSAQNNTVEVYFKNTVSDFDIIYGKAVVLINPFDVIKVQLYDLYPPMQNEQPKFYMKLVTSTDETTYGCVSQSDSVCTVNLTETSGEFDTASMSFTILDKNAVKQSLFTVNYTQKQFDLSDECMKFTLSDHNYCVYRPNLSVQCLSVCSEAMPTSCYSLPWLAPFPELPFKVPTVKVQFKSEFDERNIKATSMHVFDDTTQMFYWFLYEPVPDSDEYYPLDSKFFRMKFRIGQVQLDPAKDVQKVDYVITNFEVKSMATFENAFCEKLDSNTIRCVCCDKFTDEPMCKVKKFAQEMDFYAEVYFSKAGYSHARGHTWITNNKQFHLEIYASSYFILPQISIFLVSEIEPDRGVIETVECDFTSRAKSCFVDLMKDDVKLVHMKLCTNLDCKVLLKFRLVDKQFEDLQTCRLMPKDNSNAENECHCPSGEQPSASCFNMTLPNCSKQTSSPGKVPSFMIKMTKMEVTVPPALPTVVTAYNSQLNNYFLFKFEPVHRLSRDKRPKQDGSWKTQVHMVLIKKSTEVGTSTVEFRQLDIANNQVIEFSKAFCHTGKDGDKMYVECSCCDDSQADSCKTVDQYDFFFSTKLKSVGHVLGSGSMWSTEHSINVQLDYTYSGMPSEKVILASNEGGNKTCDKTGVCTLELTPSNKTIKIYVNFGSTLDSMGQFNIDIDGNIAVAADSECQDVSSGDPFSKMCLCMSGKYTKETCQSKLMKQCSEIRTTGAPKISFMLNKNEFLKPSKIFVQQAHYLKNNAMSPSYFHLIYEPLRDISPKHPMNDQAFLMNMSISTVDNANNEKVPAELNFNVGDSLIFFSDAYCMLNDSKKADEVKVECSCCTNVQDSADEICTAVEIKSEVKLELSLVFPKYGYVFLAARLSLNNRQVFTLTGTELTKSFSNSFRLNTIKVRQQELDIQSCQGWPECTFKFNDTLQEKDFVMLKLTLLDSGSTIQPSSTVYQFRIGSDLTIMSSKPDCSPNVIQESTFCSCPVEKSFHPKCERIIPLNCQHAKTNSIAVRAKKRNQATFQVKMKSDPGEGNPVYVFDSNFNLYFTFKYRTVQDSALETGYLVEVGATKSNKVNTSMQNIIEINFDMGPGLVVFNGTYCEVNDNRTEFFCTCCSDCEKMSSVKSTTLEVNATTTAPENSNPCMHPSGQTKTLCEILEASEAMNSTNLSDFITKTQSAMNVENATVADVHVISKIFGEIAKVENATLEGRTHAIQLLDYVLKIEKPKFKYQTINDKYLTAMHQILTQSQTDLTYLNGGNMGIHKTVLSCADNNKLWSGIKDNGQNFELENGESKSNQTTAAIELSHSHLCEQQTAGANNSVYFIIYRNDNLFHQDKVDNSASERTQDGKSDLAQHFATSKDGKANKGKNDRSNRCKKNYMSTNGIVLTSVIWNSKAVNQIRARMTFKKQDLDLPMHSNLAVTWWDKQEWSSQRQCEFELVDEEYVAYCNHLTNFALLVEKSATDPLLCDYLLDRLGFWLAVISLIALLILILIYSTRLIPIVKESIFIRVLNNNRRAGSDTFIIVYILVMLTFYFLFLVFVDQSVTQSKIVCKTTAALLYGLFLAAMLLNIFQAWDVIKTCAWNSQTEAILQMLTQVWMVLLVSFGVPGLTVILIWFMDTEFFFRNDQFCWIRPQSVIYAIMVPVSVMLINSFFTFGIFCVRMFPDCFTRLGIRRTSVRLAKGERHQRRLNLELFIALLFAQFILGFPWVLQYPAMFSSGINVWHYLFAIFNATNGLILFLIYFHGRVQAFYRIRKTNNETTATSVSQQQTQQEELSPRHSTFDQRSCNRRTCNSDSSF